MVSRRSILRAALGGAAAAGAAACTGPGSRPGAGTPSGPSPAVADSPGPPAVPTPSRPAAAAGGQDRLPAEVSSGPRTRLAVALTFHGAGDPQIARQVLAEAARAGAHLTVLAVGSWLDEQPAMARLILDGGHELGNHTQHHARMPAMSAATVYTEITGCADRLRRLTGSPGRWFRPSQMQHSTPLVQAQARRAGYPTVLSYDLDSRDFTDPGPATVTRTVLTGARPGSIVSLHLGHAGTVSALPALFDGLHRQGLRAVTVSDLLR